MHFNLYITSMLQRHHPGTRGLIGGGEGMKPADFFSLPVAELDSSLA